MALARAVLGNPLAAVAMLANHLGGRGTREIPAGTFIMTGGVTEAIAVKAGDNVAGALPRVGHGVDAVRLIPRVEARCGESWPTMDAAPHVSLPQVSVSRRRDGPGARTRHVEDGRKIQRPRGARGPKGPP